MLRSSQAAAFRVSYRACSVCAGRRSRNIDHPHRGQTTVSYVLDGMMCHEDSKGNTGV